MIFKNYFLIYIGLMFLAKHIFLRSLSTFLSSILEVSNLECPRGLGIKFYYMKLPFFRFKHGQTSTIFYELSG